MLEFFQAGGWGMWVVLVLGLVTLVTAFRFARNPLASSGPAVRAFSTATAFSVLGSLGANIAAVGHYVSRPDFDGPLGATVMMGLAESLSPVILGFTTLSAAWVLVAIGARRLQATVE